MITFPPGITPGTVGIWGIFFLLIATVVKAWPAIRKAYADGDASLRGDLLARVTTLESQLVSMQERLEAERTRHEEEMRVLRHRLNNETMSLDALLLMLETAPDQVSEAVARIKEMRARREELVSQERAAMTQARLLAADAKMGTEQ